MTCRESGSKSEDVLSFGMVRSLAFAATALTLLLSIMVSTYLGKSAGQALLSKNHSFASLLANNLNNQIYRRFTLPTLSIFGRVDLNNPDQYRQLDLIIQSIVQELNVDEVRIFSDGIVKYSINHREEVGRTDLAGPAVAAAENVNGPIFTLFEKIPYWRAFFILAFEEDTYRMRTTYPLRIDSDAGLIAGVDGGLMGILEFSQDITLDIRNSIRFQQMVLAITLLSTAMLMGLLLFMARRAELALARRVTEQQRLREELHQHEKLAGMGRVVASIAHEIRNPLGIISSSAELLLRKADGSSPGTAKIMQAIYDEARRLSRTVSDFLDYARPRQPKQEPVDVNQVLDQALTFLGPELNQRDIGVVRSGELDQSLLTPGDKDLLYRAFYNIMGNAVQAMGAAGTLNIQLERIQDPGSGIRIVFHDSGAGFPPENLERLLDPFFTTKDDGTGLGLPIVNTIITSHEGTLELANAPDGGAEVRVTLPAMEE